MDLTQTQKIVYIQSRPQKLSQKLYKVALELTEIQNFFLLTVILKNLHQVTSHFI